MKGGAMFFGWHQVPETGHDNKKTLLARRRVTETKSDLLAKRIILFQEDAIGAIQPHQQ